MPELPEVESAVRWLREHLVGRRITAVEAHHRSQARQLPPRHRARVVGCRVVGAERRGKHQFLRFDDGAVLHVHFRLDGDWSLARASAAPPRHTRVSLIVGRDRFALTDPRALCSVRYHAPGDGPELALGPEPEDPALTPREFAALLALRRVPIKPLLLDQRLLAGVGNIYATEACWHARIHPARRADLLGAPEVRRLLAGLRRTLGDGHENAGRYRRGERPIPFEAYDREAESCSRCRTAIRRIAQAGRGTWYCPRCQPLRPGRAASADEAGRTVSRRPRAARP